MNSHRKFMLVGFSSPAHRTSVRSVRSVCRDRSVGVADAVGAVGLAEGDDTGGNAAGAGDAGRGVDRGERPSGRTRMGLRGFCAGLRDLGPLREGDWMDLELPAVNVSDPREEGGLRTRRRRSATVARI